VRHAGECGERERNRDRGLSAGANAQANACNGCRKNFHRENILIAKSLSDDAMVSFSRGRARRGERARRYDPEARRALQARRVWAKVPCAFFSRCM
jgi:hypothetical protein